MNQKSTSIKMEYMAAFNKMVNEYVMMRRTRPYDNLNKYLSVIRRVGALVEIWATIERILHTQEKRHG